MEQLFVFWLAVLAMTFLPIFPPAESNTTSDKNLIIAAEKEWAAAPVQGDASRMAALMADDYVEIVMETAPGSNRNQWVTTGKQEWINLVRSGREKYTSVEVHNIAVYLHGDVATTTGEYSQTGTKDGKDISATGLYADTWVKKDGKWLVVSSVFP